MRLCIFPIFLFTILTFHNLKGNFLSDSEQPGAFENRKIDLKDTLKENQILINGRIWRNLYYMVEGDQFFFSRSFLPGSITVRGKVFNNVPLLYDIHKDEIIIALNTGITLQVKKEMVDSFTVFFESRSYHFTKLREREELGYLNILYTGKTALYIK